MGNNDYGDDDDDDDDDDNDEDDNDDDDNDHDNFGGDDENIQSKCCCRSIEEKVPRILNKDSIT